MGWTDFDPTDTGNDVFITSVDLNTVAEFRGGQTYGKEAARCRPGYSNGKWYFEFEANIGFQNISVGVGTIAADIHNEVGFDNFGWCCWLAGFAGALMAPYSTVSLEMDVAVTIECFIIIVIGGLGSTGGAFLGAIIFGLANSLGILVLPKLAIAFGFIAMAIVLIVRPWGIMGKEL